MAFYIENTGRRIINVNEAVTTLRGIKEGKEAMLYGIRAIRHVCCYSLWSGKGMMRLGLNLDMSAVALALTTLSKKVNLKGEDVDE